MIIICTRRVWSQIVDLLKQFHARGLSWKQQETERLWWESSEVWSPSGDVWTRGTGAWCGVTCVIIHSALERGSCPGKWPGVSIINCDGGENYWLETYSIDTRIIRRIYTDRWWHVWTCTNTKQQYRDSLLHSWYRSRGLAKKWFLFLAWQAAPLLFFWKYRRSNSWIQFSPNPVHHAPEWPRGGAVSWCWWQCNVCRAHCSPLNLWLSGSFTQIIGPVHKTWFMEAYWRSELYPIVQHLLILLSHSRHET